MVAKSTLLISITRQAPMSKSNTWTTRAFTRGLIKTARTLLVILKSSIKPQIYQPIISALPNVPFSRRHGYSIPYCLTGSVVNFYSACAGLATFRCTINVSSVCTDEERALMGTWCSPEINKALEMGYRMIRIHEVWSFEHHRRGLFKSYINRWLQLKTEASVKFALGKIRSKRT